MKTAIIAGLTSLMIATAVAPAFAQSIEIMLPTLTWPDDQVTVSTRNAGSAQK